uniref:Uncharacterized protein n=1 Tax=viral metagenome TaxID=1070528 RepID=A0A6C0IHC4_9ZZZZ
MKRRSTRRKGNKSKRSRYQRKTRRGGGYSFGAAVAPEAPYSAEVIGGTPGTPDCLESTRPGLAGPVQGTGGLPGFAGGGSEELANMLNAKRGGRYTFDLASGPVNGIGSAGPSAGMAEVSRIGCEGGLVNTSPPGAQANPTPLQNGGAGLGEGSLLYTAPTAGYDNRPSEWVSSAGSPSLLQIPYEARTMNQACMKTGGGRRRSRRSRKSRRIRK